jgi:CheY-like chemotaxis protein
MAKIMLVEDDNNLREIYGARLLAEGHQIVAAKDGEEALALAVKEKPDLIISDIMMPRISGFEMLDILRNAPETRNTKVIMMTALSQAEDKARADKLGADRYLVKSQVTLEDVAKVVRDVLTGEQAAPAATAAPAFDPSATTPPVSIPMPAADPSAAPAVATPPVAPAPPVPVTAQIPVTDASTPAATAPSVSLPPVDPTPVSSPVALPTPPTPTPVVSDAGQNMAQDLAAEEKAIQEQIDSFASSQVDSNPPAIANGVVQPAPAQSEPVPPVAVEQPVAAPDTVKTPENAPLDDQHNVASKRIIQPINQDLGKPDLDALLAAEEAKEAGHSETKPATPPAEPKSDVDHNSIAL